MNFKKILQQSFSKLRVWSGFLVLLTASLAPGADLDKPSFPAASPILFVFDLDDTLIRWVRPEESEGTSRIIPENGNIQGYRYRYRILDGASEIIQSILDEIPDARVAFFSAAKKERNLQVLKELKLPDGRSALDIAYRVLSEEDLDFLGETSQSEKFRGSEKKDLRKLLSRAWDLDHIFLIEDVPKRAYPGQEGNILWVGPKPKLHQVRFGEGNQNAERFFQDRNKLAWARGLVDRVLGLAKRLGVTPRQALIKVQWKGSSAANWKFNDALRKDLALYRKGAQLLHRASANYRFTHLGLGTNLRCSRLFADLPFVDATAPRP